MGERQAFRDAIVADEEVERLLERLTLVERFHAVLVTCEMPRVANALVDVLEAELPQRRDETMRFVRLDPYRAHKDILAPISADLLIDEVLAKVVHPPAENQGSSVVTIVDASRALPKDDDAWSIMFQRMNERRNAIMRALPGPFLIVAPKRYDLLFARAAADFWSILGAIVPVKTPPLGEELESDLLLMDPTAGPSLLLRVMSSMVGIPRDDNAISEAERALEEARLHCARYPNDPGAATVVAAQLIRLGALSGSLNRSIAITLLDEALEILQTQANQTNDPIAVFLTSHAFLFHGFLHFADKRFTHTLEDLEQSTRWARSAISLHPESIEFNRHLASNLLTLGILHLEMGNVDAAMKCLSESETRYRTVSSADSAEEAAEILDELATALSRLGNAYGAIRDLESALLYYAKAAETTRQALQQNSKRANMSQQLAQVLLSASKIQTIRGDYGHSVRLAEQALDTITPNWASNRATITLYDRIRAHLTQLKSAQ